MKNYLPSKKFVFLMIGFVILGIIFFVAFHFFSDKESFFSSKPTQLQTQNATLNDLLKKDSDGDGIPDWEEALWGTDPNKTATFDGVPDRTYIENKRKELKLSNPTDAGGVDQNSETAKFAQEFFASIAAMQQSGQIDSNTINNVSSALGQNIVNQTVLDKYTEGDLTLTKGDTTQDQEDYYVKAATLFEKYKTKGIGDELEITSGMAGAGASDKDSINKLNTIATAYEDFAKTLVLVPVPASLETYHLQIINNSNDTGIAVTNMTKIVADPVVGLSGLSEYQKYSEALILSVQDLETFLSVNGIINQ